MRLIYVYDTWLPSSAASAVNVMKTCEALAAEGHQVTLVHFGRGNQFADYDVRHQFGTLALPVSPGRRGAIRLLAWVGAIRGRLTGAVVYARKPALIVPAAALGCPVALELHAPVGAETPGSQAALARLMKRERKRRPSLISISQALANQISVDWPSVRVPITIAHDAAEPGPAPEPLSRTGRERPLLGYAGHLYPGKGMEMIAELSKARPDWDFLVVGGRPQDLAHWKSRTVDLDNLEFTGMLPHSKVRKRLAQADILLAPYGRTVIVSDGRLDVVRWMSPLKLFEYMAMAKPMVISDLPVIREIVRDRDNGRLAAAGEAKDWERVISELLQNPSAAAAMGRRAREELERSYSWRCRARTIVQAIGA